MGFGPGLTGRSSELMWRSSRCAGQETRTRKQEGAGKTSSACNHCSWKEFMPFAAQKVGCLRAGDRCFGISGSRKCKAAGRFHFRGVMLLHENASASSRPKAESEED